MSTTAKVVGNSTPGKLKQAMKPKAPKQKQPKTVKTASHPPYFQMIKEALQALKEKGGSSPYAIAKYMEEKHKAVLPSNFKKMLGLQLKNSATRGKLIKVKASYKLSESAKEKVSTKVPKKTNGLKKKPTKSTTTVVRKSGGVKKTVKPVKKGVVRKTVNSVKKGVVKKVNPVKRGVVKKAKKAVPAKLKSKQPRSIKSPAAKKARKGVV